MADLRAVLQRHRAAELTVEPLLDTVAEFGTAVGESVGKDYNIANSRVENFLRDYMSARVSMINGTTRKQLQQALDSDDPVGEVGKVFEHARNVRARMIAQSEVVRGSNFAAIDAGKWVAELDFKRWASQKDDRVRHTHTVLEGDVVPWNEKFTSPSGATASAPGLFDVPDENVGCRCAAVPARTAQRRNLGEFGDPVELYEAVREPFVDQMEAAWRAVFDEQEAVLMAGQQLPR